MSNSPWPHRPKPARLPCPSLCLTVCSNSYPLSWWCHTTISYSVIPFSCLQSFPASGSFPMSQFFLDHKESWAPKNWCFWTVVLEKTLEGPLDCREINPVNPKGNQSWILIGRTDAEAETLILWPPDMKSPLIGKCWERLRLGGEGSDRGWDGWMTSLIQ